MTVEIRPLHWPDEIPRWAALHNEVNPDRPMDAVDLEAVYGSRVDTGFFLAVDGPAAVGYGWVTRNSDSPVPRARILVLPAHRRRGTGSGLFAAISECAAGHGHRELDGLVREVQPEGLEFAAHRGFVETGRTIEVALDLTAIEPPAVELPAGVEIVTWAERPELSRGIYEIDLEAIPDIPGEDAFAPEPFEQWLVRSAGTVGGPKARPEATFVALGGGEAIGYARLSIWAATPTIAEHELTGVKRAWRGKGVARALKATQIRWAKEAGFERLVTSNDESNGPIRRLNERFGYRPQPGDVLLRGPIAAP